MNIIKYATELDKDRKLSLVKETEIVFDQNMIRHPEDAFHLMETAFHISNKSEEYVYMLVQDTKGSVVGVFEISHGSLNESHISAREIFKKALLLNAYSIILIHNHPSGDVIPSLIDMKVTRKIFEAGKMLDIRLNDHIIIGDENWRSLLESDPELFQ